MDTVQTAPGPDAARAFRLGMVTSAVVGLIVIATLYWIGALQPLLAGYLLVVLYPIYLVFAATALSVWLGYDKDVTSLRPVYKQRESASGEE